jgi:hypothetical protein
MPYISRAIATDPEWRVAALDVYVSLDDGPITLLTLSDTEENLTADYWIDPVVGSSNDQKYTVTMSDTWLDGKGGSSANFYFVANAATSMNGLTFTAAQLLDDTAFTNTLTAPLTPTGPGGDLQIITKPTDASAATTNLLFSDVIEDVIISNSVSTKGELIRRVARFDIDNPSVVSDNPEAFVVEKIIVTNATDRGYVFGMANPASEIGASSVLRGTYNDIMGGVPLDNDTDYVIDVDATPNPDGTVAPAVFYLYPTTLGPAATDTHIWVQGTSKGDTRLIPVVLDAAKPILANNRYVITVKVASLTATLDEIDYFEGGKVNHIASSKANPIADVAVGVIDETGLNGATWLWGDNFAEAEIDAAALTMDFQNGYAGDGSSEVVIPITSTWGTNYLLEGATAGVSGAVSVGKTTDADIDTLGVEVSDEYTITVAAGTTNVDLKLTIFAADEKGGSKVINIKRIAAIP